MSRLKMNVRTVGPAGAEYPSAPHDLPEGTGNEVCLKILQCLTQKRIYLDRNLSLAKFSSIVGTTIEL